MCPVRHRGRRQQPAGDRDDARAHRPRLSPARSEELRHAGHLGEDALHRVPDGRKARRPTRARVGPRACRSGWRRAARATRDAVCARGPARARRAPRCRGDANRATSRRWLSRLREALSHDRRHPRPRRRARLSRRIGASGARTGRLDRGARCGAGRARCDSDRAGARSARSRRASRSPSASEAFTRKQRARAALRVRTR